MKSQSENRYRDTHARTHTHTCMCRNTQVTILTVHESQLCRLTAVTSGQDKSLKKQ